MGIDKKLFKKFIKFTSAQELEGNIIDNLLFTSCSWVFAFLNNTGRPFMFVYHNKIN